jgi:hypothetical protein
MCSGTFWNPTGSSTAGSSTAPSRPSRGNPRQAAHRQSRPPHRRRTLRSDGTTGPRVSCVREPCAGCAAYVASGAGRDHGLTYLPPDPGVAMKREVDRREFLKDLLGPAVSLTVIAGTGGEALAFDDDDFDLDIRLNDPPAIPPPVGENDSDAVSCGGSCATCGSTCKSTCGSSCGGTCGGTCVTCGGASCNASCQGACRTQSNTCGCPPPPPK